MIFKMLSAVEGEQQIYARIDDDGLCRLTCTSEHPEFQAWLAEGNEPLPADEPTPSE
jgi:hypothetical protein